MLLFSCYFYDCLWENLLDSIPSDVVPFVPVVQFMLIIPDFHVKTICFMLLLAFSIITMVSIIVIAIYCCFFLYFRQNNNNSINKRRKNFVIVDSFLFTMVSIVVIVIVIYCCFFFNFRQQPTTNKDFHSAGQLYVPLAGPFRAFKNFKCSQKYTPIFLVFYKFYIIYYVYMYYIILYIHMAIIFFK